MAPSFGRVKPEEWWHEKRGWSSSSPGSGMMDVQDLPLPHEGASFRYSEDRVTFQRGCTSGDRKDRGRTNLGSECHTRAAAAAMAL